MKTRGYTTIGPEPRRVWDLGFKPTALTFTDTVGEEILSKLSHEEVQRQAVIFELISTEENYNKDLDIIQRVFLQPIRDRQLLSKEEIVGLFSNIEPIIELNKAFLKDLRKLQLQEQVISTIGPILLKWIAKFDIYLGYCSNHSYITERLRQYKAQHPDFDKFTEECFVLPECRLLYIDSFLIAPLQRICKYPLLFRELAKHTPEGHGDRQAVKSASEEMIKLVTMINERTRQAENIDKMMVINGKLEYKDGAQIELINAKRTFIKEGVFHITAQKKQLKDVQVYLFNDIMLITKKKRRDRDSGFLVLNKVPLDAVLVRTQKDVPHIKENMFEVVHMGDVVYTFEPTTQSQEEMRIWASEVNKQATIALETAARLQEHRRSLIEESGDGQNSPNGAAPAVRNKTRLDREYSLNSHRRPSLLNFFLGSLGGAVDDSSVRNNHTSSPLNPHRYPQQQNNSSSSSGSGSSSPTSISPTAVSGISGHSPPGTAGAMGPGQPRPKSGTISGDVHDGSASLRSPLSLSLPNASLTGGAAAAANGGVVGAGGGILLPTANAYPTQQQLPVVPDPQELFSPRGGSKEVLRESLRTERRLKLEALEKADRLGTELEVMKKKYRGVKDKTYQLDRAKRKSASYEGKREVDLARSRVKELRQERTVLERELHYQKEDNKHLRLQLQVLEQRAEMHQRLLLLYSQQVAAVTMSAAQASPIQPLSSSPPPSAYSSPHYASPPFLSQRSSSSPPPSYAAQAALASFSTSPQPSPTSPLYTSSPASLTYSSSPPLDSNVSAAARRRSTSSLLPRVQTRPETEGDGY